MLIFLLYSCLLYLPVWFNVVAGYPQSFDLQRRVKVYVYSRSDHAIVNNLTRCFVGTHFDEFWGTEAWFHTLLKRSAHAVMNPRRADFFFVPVYARCLFRQFWKNETFNSAHVNRLYAEAMHTLPYVKVAGMHRHIFLFTNARGPTQFADWRKYIPQAIMITPEPHFSVSHPTHTPYFFAHKDIIMPGHTKVSMQTKLVLANRPAAERQYLVSYPKGTVRGRSTRLQVVELGEKHPELLKLTGDYVDLLTNSRFCILPRGAGSWTRRTYEAIFAGCIPVFLSDPVAMPFERVIDYSRFTIKWPVTSVDESLLLALNGTSVEVVEEARRALASVHCMFQWQNKHQPCSPFAGIVHELLMRLELAKPLAAWQKL